MSKTQIATVVGARPQFVKAGPMSLELSRRGWDELLINTGQHYDPILSEEIARDVGLREPDVNLGVGSGSHGSQTAATLVRVEEVLLEQHPDAVIVYGDTNATIAGTLAAAKLHIPVIHVEAGLRSFNRIMPEELNRVATDHLADLLCAPTATAMTNLEAEGLAGRSVLTGDVMVDAVRSIPIERTPVPDWANGDFFVATLHRAENTDDRSHLEELLRALASLDDPVHLLAHPRLQARIAEFGLDLDTHGSLNVRPPLTYARMLAVVAQATGLLTDSGGLQKEAFILETPTVTLRTETEWPETLEGDWNVIAGNRLDELPSLVRRTPTRLHGSPFGEGNAAELIADAISAL